ncbi:MAG: CBS domain-containing protein, partial [Actinomycetota bacterium]
MSEHETEARTVGHLMTHDPVHVGPDDDVGRAHDLMRGRGVGAVPVVEDGTVVGILTATDLLFDPDELSRVAAIMSGPPVTVHPSTTVADAASLMQERFIHHLIVLDEDDVGLVGIVSSWDLLGDLASTVRSQRPN